MKYFRFTLMILITATANAVGARCIDAMEKERYAEAVPVCKKEAEAGDGQAQYALGFAYFNGYGIAADRKNAFHWVTKASEKNLPEAHNLLGIMYEKGEGVQRDLAMSLKLYQASAQQGFDQGQYNMGRLYEQGIGVNRDTAIAADWYRKAVDQGHVLATINLGSLLFKGDGVAKDERAAVALFEKTAASNHIIVLANLGVAYLQGRGAPQDFSKAFTWFSKAAEQGDGQANFVVAKMYYNGQGTEKNLDLAAKHAIVATKKKYPGASNLLYVLGLMYIDGADVARNISQGYFLVTVAAQFGQERAPAYLQQLENSMQSDQLEMLKQATNAKLRKL